MSIRAYAKREMPEGLTIALDGTPLAGPIGGIRRFTDELLLALRAEFPANHYVPVSDQFLPFPSGLEQRWWAFGLNRALGRLGAKVFHGTDFSVPYISRRPSVLTVHDLSPWLDPSPLSARVRQRCGLLLRLRIPRFVHTPSEAVRRELLNRFSFPEGRVVAIPLAAAERFEAGEKTDGEPYFLYLGTLEGRKNLEVLRRAMELLAERGMRARLVLAGQARPGYEVPQHESIEWIGPQQEGRLPGLYRNARAVLYPSRYEGFGLPVLEAMQCGAPVIASDIAVLREAGGEAAMYAAPGSAEEWAERMAALWTDAALRESRGGLGIERAKMFSWRRTAIAFQELYERCLR